MRTQLIIAMLLACALLACSLVTRPDEQAEPPAAPPAPPPSTGIPPAAAGAKQPYHGEQSIEERIVNADTIVKARLATTTSEIATTTTEEWSDYHYVALRFHLTVSEYLRGSGESSITAFAIQGGGYDTQSEAEDTEPGIAANKVTTWDDLEAIIFLNSDDHYDIFSAAVQGANDYFLSIGGPYQDRYSLQDRYSKLWLPSAGTSATGDDQEFLLAVPEPGKDTPTITIRELKSRIAAINAELNAGDGSEAYRNCVSIKYQAEREERHAQSEGRKLGIRAVLDTHRLVSGSPAGTVIFESDGFGIYPDTRMQTSLEGGDADLFETVDGPTTPDDWNRDGVLTDGIDFIRYTQSLRPVRPIPAGDYRFTVKDLEPNMIPCNAFLVTEWTVSAIAPEGTLHEAFFDPVTDGNAVAADSANGVLKLASFTDTNGATSTIQRIAWESGSVEMRLSPHTGLAGHRLDFIELDGTVSLSLSVSDAAVDAPNATLSWPVPSQSWEDGAKLMLRIREALPYAPAPTGLTAAPSAMDAADLSWNPVSGASGYQVQRRESGQEAWQSVDASVTGTTHKAAGLRCGATYEFRVGAYGDGTTYDRQAGLWSATATATTGACSRPPVFATSSYAFTIDAGAATGTPVGVVSATDPEGGAVSYSITAGNDAGVFAIDSATGRISVAGPLFLEPAPSRVLTVRAADADGGAATAKVVIAVTSVCRDGVVLPHTGADLVADCLILYHGVMRTLAGSFSLDWSADNPITDWQGVRVRGGRVQQLRLAELGLDGSIPPALGALTGLTRIDLYENALTGPVPPQLGQLSNLKHLFLFDNRLTGKIPPELGQLSNLARLDLDTNRLTGGIPPELGGLANLTHLHLFDNDLTGEIPPELGGLASLQVLYLSGNDLSGAVPARLGELTELTELNLSNNRLTGSIPPALAELAELEELWLSDNRLIGAIPPGLARLDLDYLFLAGNALTGCVPLGLREAANNDLADLGLPDCANRAPVFATSSYAFSVAENAATSTPVGTVSATDPDAGDAVSYSITAGNDGGEFAIDPATGALTVAGALSRKTAASHTLTVRAADGRGGAATATVVVSVTDPG